MTTPVEKPEHLKNPRRAFVKKTGKKLVRKIAAFQSQQSKVPDTPKLGNEHFDFLGAFTDNWETIQAEAREVLKFRDAIPTINIVSQRKITGRLLFSLGLAKGLRKMRLWRLKPLGF